MPADAPLRAPKPRKTYGVKKAKPSMPAPAFRPLGSQVKDHGFGVQKSRLKKQSYAAQKKVPSSPKLPRVPIKKTYTSAEKRTIATGLKTARGTGSNKNLYDASNRDERQHLAQLGKVLAVKQTSKPLKAGRPKSGANRLATSLVHPVSAHLNFKLPNGGKITNAAILAHPITKPIESLLATGVAAYHDPIGVPVKTAEGGVKMLKAAPSGIVNSALHPAKTLKELVADEKARHGQSFAAKVKRIRKEGAAPEIADTIAVASLGGATAGRLALKVARKQGYKFAVKPRPALRVSGGIAKKQELAPNIGRALAQRGHDALRARKLRDVPAQVATGEKVAPLKLAAVKHGDVVRLRPQKVDRTLAKAVARTKSIAVHRMKGEQARRVDRVAGKAIAKLNPHEKRAFYYVSSGIAPAEPTGFTHAMTKRLASIKTNRATDEVPAPTGLLKRTDELHTIPKIDVSKIDFAKLRDTHQGLFQEAVKIGREDPALNAGQRLQRRYAQQAETLGLKRGEIPVSGGPGVPAMHYGEESTAAFVNRVKQAAKARGLERPVYFPSEKYDMSLQPDFASRAVGGVRGVRGPRTYTGKNFRLGVQDTSPNVFLTGLSRNLKRKHNWRLVSDLAEQHSIGGLRGSANGVRDTLMRQGADPHGYVLWNPRVFRTEMTKVDTDAAKQTELLDLGVKPEDYAKQALAKAIDTEHYGEQHGWVAIPRQAWKEIEDSAKPSGAVGRSWDIFKAKNSRVLLGVGNIPWLQFQVVSNALLAGAATKGALLFDLPKAVKWWKGLDDATKEEADALLGGGTTHDVAQPQLGAAANNKIVDGYRTMKSMPIWDKQIKGHGPSLRQLNPIEASFAADRTQNAWFKRTVLYSQVKRDAFHRMGSNMTLAQRAQSRIVHALTLGPKDAMDALVKDKDALIAAAEHTNDWLGDYTTYTAAERKVLNRSVMFYGFLRYSLKFVFYTMPVKHPVETAIVAKLGQLQADEIEKLLGGADLPWAFGKLYITQDGKLKSVDFARANPALNTLTQSFTDKPSNWTSLAPPVAVSILEQLPGIGGRKFWADRGWRVDGTSPQYGANRSSFSTEDSARIFVDEMLGMAAPYRIGEKLSQTGPQGDDSLLWDARPTEYKGQDNRSKAIRKSIAKSNAFEKSADDLIHQLVPLLPERSRDDEAARDSAAVDAASKPHPRKKKPFGASGSKGYFGASKSKGYFGAGG